MMASVPIFESFFDDNFQSPSANIIFKLWKKINSLIHEPIIYKGHLYKAGKKSGSYKLREFALTTEKLYCLRNNTVSGELSLKFVRCDFFENPSNPDHKFGIKLIKNLKFFNLFVKEKSEFAEWKNLLTRICIQSDFHTKFNVIKMIGKGSFAKVYLIENKESLKKFAVKAFLKDFILGQANGRLSLMNEISILKSIDHPNLLKLEEVHESQNSIYLVMELTDGGELLEAFKIKKTIKIEESQKMLYSILQGLKYLDKKGIMHRDLKPENLVFKDKANKTNLTIVDFGLATYVNVDEYLFKRCGTPGFVAPEIINAPSSANIKYTSKCDIFSCGVIFYILITGKSCFEGKNINEILQLNKDCKISYSLPIFQAAQMKSALDLLQKMLLVDPVKRVSAEEALNHPFFSGFVSSYEELPEDTEIQFNDNFANSYMNKDKNMSMLSNNSLVMQSKYITGQVNSYHESNGSNGNSPNSPSSKNNSIDMLSPKLKGKGFDKNSTKKDQNFYKMALQNLSKKSDSPKNFGKEDSFNSLSSADEESKSSDEGPASPKGDKKKIEKSNQNPVKLKNKASSFRINAKQIK